MENKLTLSKSLETGFIDQLIHSQKRYRPELLTNNKAKEKKVLTHLIRELCDYWWSGDFNEHVNRVRKKTNQRKSISFSIP